MNGWEIFKGGLMVACLFTSALIILVAMYMGVSEFFSFGFVLIYGSMWVVWFMGILYFWGWYKNG